MITLLGFSSSQNLIRDVRALPNDAEGGSQTLRPEVFTFEQRTSESNGLVKKSIAPDA